MNSLPGTRPPVATIRGQLDSFDVDAHVAALGPHSRSTTHVQHGPGGAWLWSVRHTAESCRGLSPPRCVVARHQVEVDEQSVSSSVIRREASGIRSRSASRSSGIGRVEPRRRTRTPIRRSRSSRTRYHASSRTCAKRAYRNLHPTDRWENASPTAAACLRMASVLPQLVAGHTSTSSGRQPTRLMAPLSKFQQVGQSARLERRRKATIAALLRERRERRAQRLPRRCRVVANRSVNSVRAEDA